VSDSTLDHAVEVLRQNAGKNGEPLYIAVERSVVPPNVVGHVVIPFEGNETEPVGFKLVSTLAGESNEMRAPHIVAEIMTGSAAHTAGELQAGDQIIRLNGMSVADMNHEQVSA
jgi:hypothetical protein